MYNAFVTACWLAAIVYATVPAYWLLVHPFVDFWRARAARLRRVGPLWVLLWGLAGLATYPWLRVFLYRTPLAWIPGGLLILTALAIYYGARHGFSMDQVLGRSELEPGKHEQRLVITGLRGRMRHPLYLAHLCDLLGLTIGTGSVALFALTAFALPTGALMIWMEERELERRFGDDYRAYKRRVPLVPQGRNAVIVIILALVVLILLSLTVGIGVGRRAVLGNLLPAWIGLLFLILSLAAFCGPLPRDGSNKSRKAAGITLGLACGILGLVTLGLAYRDAQRRSDFRQFAGQEAIRASVGCKTTSSSHEVADIMGALRGAEAFSGRVRWQASLHLTIQLHSGEERDLTLASELYQGRVVAAYHRNGFVAAPGLLTALKQAGLAHAEARWEPSAGRNVDFIVADDPCSQSNPH